MSRKGELKWWGTEAGLRDGPEIFATWTSDGLVVRFGGRGGHCSTSLRRRERDTETIDVTELRGVYGEGWNGRCEVG